MDVPDGDWKIALQYLGHSGFRIVGEQKNIFIDPYLSEDGGNFKRLIPPAIMPSDIQLADLLLITHDHFDHCDVPSIEMILKRTNALAVGNAAVERKLHSKITLMRPLQKLNLRGIEIQAVKADHPGENPLGFIITLAGVRIYHAGDTDSVPEKIKCDIAILPVGGLFTMDAKEAEKSAEKMGAKAFIPMHYNTFEPIKIGEPPGNKLEVGEWMVYGS